MLTFHEFITQYMRWRYSEDENSPLTDRQVEIINAIGANEKLFYVGPRKVGASSIASAWAVYDAAILASRVFITGPNLLIAEICFDVAKFIASTDEIKQVFGVEKITRKTITFSSGGSISMRSRLGFEGMPPGFTCVIDQARLMDVDFLNYIAAIAGKVVAISTGSATPYFPRELGSAYRVQVRQEVAV